MKIMQKDKKILIQIKEKNKKILIFLKTFLKH